MILNRYIVIGKILLKQNNFLQLTIISNDIYIIEIYGHFVDVCTKNFQSNRCM